MSSPQKLQFSKLKYPFSSSDHRKSSKSFLSNYCNQIRSPQSTLTPTFIHNSSLPFSNTSNVQSRKSAEHTISQRHHRTNPTRNLNNKYALVPNISKMKHLSNEAIDTLLNTIECMPETERYSTISIERDNDIINTREGELYTQQVCRNKINKTARMKIITSKYLPIEENKTVEITPSAIDNNKTNINDTDGFIAPHFIAKTSKLLLANVNQTKQDSFLLNNNNTNTRASEGKRTSILPSIRRGSAIDKLIFKVMNPHDCIEDHLLKEYPGDKYKRFKNQLVKEKHRISQMMNDITKHQNQNDNLLKVYVNQLKCKKTHN